MVFSIEQPGLFPGMGVSKKFTFHIGPGSEANQPRLFVSLSTPVGGIVSLSMKKTSEKVVVFPATSKTCMETKLVEPLLSALNCDEVSGHCEV